MTAVLFSEVRGEPLSSLVLQRMREAIIAGHLMPNEAINEVELAKQLGISRAPLREAIRQLENEGLVTRVPYRGTTVAPLTARGIEELQTFRCLLETHAAEQIIRHGTDADIESLEVVVKQMAGYADAGDLDGMNIADIRFHTRIIELTQSDLLLDVWQSHVQRLRRAMTLRNRANPNLDSLVKLHRELLAAFRVRDLDQVKRCYDTHGADIVIALQHLLQPEKP